MPSFPFYWPPMPSFSLMPVLRKSTGSTPGRVPQVPAHVKTYRDIIYDLMLKKCQDHGRRGSSWSGDKRNMKHKQELFDQPLMCASTNPFLPAPFSVHEGSCMDCRAERNHFKPLSHSDRLPPLTTYTFHAHVKRHMFSLFFIGPFDMKPSN